MSAMPCILETAHAVASSELPVWRARPLDGLAFYRRHSEGLLRKYLAISMEIGRVPCVLGNVAFRSRMSSYRMRSFEDQVIFVLDVERCLKQLDPISQQVVAHIALESYSIPETAALTRESLRSVARIYTVALDRLTRLFLDFRLLGAGTQKLSRVSLSNESND